MNQYIDNKIYNEVVRDGYIKDIILDTNQYSKAEATLYGRFIKYERLDYLLKKEFSSLEPFDTVNVFIDLQQMTLPLYRFDTLIHPMGILATMINSALHYRNYFNKKNIKSNIFMIYSTNNSINNLKYISNYNSSYINKRERNIKVKEILINNIELLKTLIPYFIGIYLKLGTVEPSVIIYDIINKISREYKTSPNLIISSSDLAFQLPSILKNVYLLYKKTSIDKENSISTDISFIVNNDNALIEYILNTKNKEISHEEAIYLNQNWVSPFMIITGLQCRNIKGIFSYKKALEILKFIKGNFSVITPESIYDAICLLYKHKIFKNEIIERYCAIDLDYQLKLYRESPESIEVSWLQDLYDVDTLYDIITKYFVNNIVDLSKL